MQLKIEKRTKQWSIHVNSGPFSVPSPTPAIPHSIPIRSPHTARKRSPEAASKTPGKKPKNAAENRTKDQERTTLRNGTLPVIPVTVTLKQCQNRPHTKTQNQKSAGTNKSTSGHINHWTPYRAYTSHRSGSRKNRSSNLSFHSPLYLRQELFYPLWVYILKPMAIQIYSEPNANLYYTFVQNSINPVYSTVREFLCQKWCMKSLTT